MVKTMPAKDRKQRRATWNAWYARTKEARHEREAPRIKRNRQRRNRELAVWYAELKSQLACSRCGESHPACLQFHHTEPETKEISLSDALRRGYSRARMLAEIAKCIVYCANCHIKHHAGLL